MSPYNRPSITDNCLYRLSQFLESYTADMKFYQDFRYTVPLFSTLCAAPGNWQLKHLDLGRSSNPHQCTSAKHLLFRVLTCELGLLQNIWVDPASDIAGFPKLWILDSTMGEGASMTSLAAMLVQNFEYGIRLIVSLD